MSHILDKCHVFNFSESYAYADKVRKAIFEDKYVIDPVEIASNIDDLCLSRYIEEQHRDNNTGVTVQVTEDLEQQHKFDYVEYLEELLLENALPTIIHEVFTLLFSDREAMKAFNLNIANYLGVKTPRCTYWPKWLERALFCREKGLCALCKSDLTSLFHTHGKLAIDHIVPIALFGVNDPTNLQILCEVCNSKKSGNEVITSNTLPVFW